MRGVLRQPAPIQSGRQSVFRVKTIMKILTIIMSFRMQAFSKARNTKLSFPRKWESTSYYRFWIPVFTGMTYNSRLLTQPLRNLIVNFRNRFLSRSKIGIEMTLIILFFSNASFSQDKDKIDFESCTFKNFPLYGKVKFVESFPGKP